MAKSEKLPLSPMLVQYLVGLCALKWDADAVDVVVGDYVDDVAGGRPRDVDVTVTVNASDGLHAFKGYEVKHEGTALSVDDVDGLVNKLKDMPAVTHRAIVSTSGFSDTAISKAAYHDTDLYVIKPWTRPMSEQFPDLAPMSGPPEQHIGGVLHELVWDNWNIHLDFTDQVPPFRIDHDAKLFNEAGRKHPEYGTFGEYSDAIIVRSTGHLFTLQPMLDRLQPWLDAHEGGAPPPGEPQWPFGHTLDVAADRVYVKVNDQQHLVTTLTIYGDLRWQLKPMLLYVMEKVPTGEAFAGAIVALSNVPGRMWAMILAAKGRTFSTRWVQLDKKHLNKIEKLAIALTP